MDSYVDPLKPPPVRRPQPWQPVSDGAGPAGGLHGGQGQLPAPLPLPTPKPGDFGPPPQAPPEPGPAAPAGPTSLVPGWTWQNGGWVPPGGTAGGGDHHGGPGDAGGGGGTGDPTNLNDAVRQRLIALLNSDPSAANINDPALKGQADAFALGQQRSQERERAILADRRGGQGLGQSGAMDTDVNKLEQQRGEAESMYNAQLVGQELQSRRAMLMGALEQGTGLLSAEEQRAAQIEIANIDAATRRLGIETQGQLGVGQLNLGLLDLLQRGQIAGNQLGFDMSRFQWNANNPWSIFGGGTG